MSDNTPLRMYLVGNSAEQASEGIVWDDYTLAEEYMNDEGFTQIYAVDVVVDFSTMKLIP